MYITQEEIEEIKSICPNTAVMVYDEMTIIKRLQKLKESFSWNSGFTEFFPIKATPNPSICKILKENGCGFDCSSATELYIAKELLGVNNLIFHSCSPTRGELNYTFKKRGIINCNSYFEFEELQQNNILPDTICFRYNPGYANIKNKFGMKESQIIEAVKQLPCQVKIGLHEMLKTNSLTSEYYEQVANQLLELAIQIKEKTTRRVSFIDLGGGIGIPYHEGESEIDISQIGKKVQHVYRKILSSQDFFPSIYTEVGRWITGPAGYTLTKVVNKNNAYKNFVYLDIGSGQLPIPFKDRLKGTSIQVVGKETLPKTEEYYIVGNLCDKSDIFSFKQKFPNIEIGDNIIIANTGAHCAGLANEYNGKLAIPELLKKKDGTFELIRQKGSIEDYLAPYVGINIRKQQETNYEKDI